MTADAAARLYDAWLAALEQAGVEAVGHGHVTVHRVEGPGSATVEEWPWAVGQPLGPHLAAAADRADWLGRTDDAGLLAARLRVAEDVVQEQHGAPGAEHPEQIVLRQQVGLRRAQRCDTATAALVGACDGAVPLGALVDAVVELLDLDPMPARDRLVGEVRLLVAGGLLDPVPAGTGNVRTGTSV